MARSGLRSSKANERPFPFLNLPLELRAMVYRIIFRLEERPICFLSSRSRYYRHSSYPRRSLEILRTNRQVYFEAAHILHSELDVEVTSQDVQRSRILDGSSPWSHNPMQGIGKTLRNGTQVYPSPQLKEGLAPHVFARYKKILLYLPIRLPWEDVQDFMARGDDAGNTFGAWVRSSHAARYHQSLLKNLKAVISNSPEIHILLFHMSIAFMFDDMYDDYSWVIDDDLIVSPENVDYLKAENDERRAGKEWVAKQIARSGILNPIATLGNVRELAIEFNFYDHDVYPEFVLPDEERQMLADLEIEVSERWQRRCRRGGSALSLVRETYKPTKREMRESEQELEDDSSHSGGGPADEFRP